MTLLEKAVKIGLVAFVVAGFQSLLDRLEELVGTASLDLLAGGDALAANGLTNIFLDRLEAIDVAAEDKVDGFAVAPCTTGAANAVDVVFGVLWELKVHDEFDIIDVKSASGDIGSDKDLDGSLTELGEDALTHGLRNIAVEAVCGEATGEERLGEVINDALGITEDEGKLGLFDVDDAGERLHLRAAADLVARLVDAGDRESLALDLDELGLITEFFDEATHAWVHSGGEEESLTVLGQDFEHVFHLLAEAHVEHAVGFVQNDRFDVTWIKTFSAEVI